MTDTTRDLLISMSSHMAYMQGQLEARHELDDPEGFYWYRESVLLRQKVTDALGKEEPAVPEGREPVSVVGEPSDEDLLELAAAEMNNAPNWEEPEYSYEAGNPFPYEAPGVAWVNFARAVLSRWGNPMPVPLADGDVAELVADQPAFASWLAREMPPGTIIGDPYWWAPRIARHAAELLQRQALVPVSVSERLPGPSDCAPWPKDSDASAWCWAGTVRIGGWNWEQRPAGCLAMFPDDFTHWLPAHALPIPHQQENAND